MKVADLGERELIERIAGLLGDVPPEVLVPIGDDAAVMDPRPGRLIVLTCDALVSGTHFTPKTHAPFDVGYKALAVNISDAAAMAAEPRFATVSLCLPAETTVAFVDELYKGLVAAAKEYGVFVVGGDVNRSGELCVDVALMGDVEPELLRRRSDAKAGDRILVTGALGGSAAGLRVLRDESARRAAGAHARALVDAHVHPRPRVKEARIAARAGAHAIEDISDGLAVEVNHICDASRVGAVIQAERIPLALGVAEVAAATGADPAELALGGGEDYELVITARPDAVCVMEAGLKGITAVADVGGVVPASEGRTVVSRDGRKAALGGGYRHF